MPDDRPQFTPSRVPTGQSTPRLDQVERRVRRHLEHPWERQPNPAQRPVFDAIVQIHARATPVILDAGCGTGVSTARLAALHPDAHVVGVDKSLQRLAKAPPLPPNATLLRGELIDLWLFAAAERLRFTKLWLLYPNPWAKPAQLAKRWYGHAIFPMLMRSAAEIELRTNWSVYAREAAHAMSVMLGRAVVAEPFESSRSPATEGSSRSPATEGSSRSPATEGSEPLSPFERKYQASGHPLWRICCEGAPW